MRPIASVICVLSVFAAGCNCRSDQSLLPFGETEPVPSVEAPTSTGAWLSLDRSPEGQRITMSFYDRDATALGWAVGGIEDDGSVTWSWERVDGYGDGAPNVGMYTSQKTAPDGSVWVAYQDVEGQGLKVAHRTNPGVWDVQTVVAGPGQGFWNSLAIDAAGQPVIAHCDLSGQVWVSRFDGTQFGSSVVYTSTAATPSVGTTALTILVDREYLAFQDLGTGELHLQRGVGGTWNDEVVDGGGVGAWPSLLATGNELHIAYQDVTNRALKHAVQEGTGQWAIDTIDDAPLHGADTALIAQNGEPSIVYFDGMYNDVWVASRSGTEWTTSKLTGDAGAMGYHNEVVEVGGRIFVGTYDFTSDALVLSTL